MSQEIIYKDIVDKRDFIFSSSAPLTETYSLKDFVSVIEDQKQTNSCTAHAGTSAFEILLTIQGNFFETSRLFLYYVLRNGYPTLAGKDTGAYTRDICRSLSTFGICDEILWPFAAEKINAFPPQEVSSEAIKNRATKYERIIENQPNTLELVKQALCSNKPIIVGMALDDRFVSAGQFNTFSAQVGTYKVLSGSKSIGGHAMVIVGFENDNLIFENSWGASWGANGFICIPYDTIKTDIMDLWVLSEIVTDSPPVVPVEIKITWYMKIFNLIKYFLGFN